MSRLLPSPIGSASLAILWLVVAGTVEPAHLLLAIGVGLAVPPLMQRFGPAGSPVANWRAAARLTAVVLYDIVIANLAVARLVLGPASRLRPRFIDVPLDTDHPQLNALFASIITMTPGTVSCEVDIARRTILVHALDVDDPLAAARDMKARYEAPLKEIFGC